MSTHPLVYAGVGSRSTPAHVNRLMQQFAYQSARHGWKLRTGGAKGADQAFENGVRQYIRYLKVNDVHGHYAKEPFGMMEIYCAHYPSTQSRPKEYIVPEEDGLPSSEHYTQNFHPAPENLTGYVRKLMNRNAYQILGPNLDHPVNFVVCWTQDGDRENPCGGTGQAIRIASFYGIPVYNLQNEADYKELWLKLKQMKEV